MFFARWIVLPDVDDDKVEYICGGNNFKESNHSLFEQYIFGYGYEMHQIQLSAKIQR